MSHLLEATHPPVWPHGPLGEYILTNLTAVIQLMDKSEGLEYEHASQARWTNLLILVIVLIFCGFALWLLGASHPDLLMEIVSAAALIVGGLGAGIGYTTWRAQKNN